MSHTRTLLHFARRQKPTWKLHPAERSARGLCPYCLESDPRGDHVVFGCSKGGAR